MKEKTLKQVTKEAEEKYSNRIPIINKHVFKITGEHKIILNEVYVVDLAFTCEFKKFKGLYSVGNPVAYIFVDVNILRAVADPDIFEAIKRMMDVFNKDEILNMFPQLRYFIEKKIKEFLGNLGMDDIGVKVEDIILSY